MCGRRQVELDRTYLINVECLRSNDNRSVAKPQSSVEILHSKPEREASSLVASHYMVHRPEDFGDILRVKRSGYLTLRSFRTGIHITLVSGFVALLPF
jgi:hypothetical protein